MAKGFLSLGVIFWIKTKPKLKIKPGCKFLNSFYLHRVVPGMGNTIKSYPVKGIVQWVGCWPVRRRLASVGGRRPFGGAQSS